MVENMNATDLTQAHQWKKTLTDILDKHPKAKLVIAVEVMLNIGRRGLALEKA